MFHSHISELSYRIIYPLLSLIISSLISFNYLPQIMKYISGNIFKESIAIIYTSLGDALFNMIILSIWVGGILVFPLFILNLYLYLRSGFYEYEALFWNSIIKWIVIIWYPYNWVIISKIWPKIARWLRSYEGQYDMLSYLPTIEKFMGFIISWSWISSISIIIIIFMIRKIWEGKKIMRRYRENREKYILITLIIGGIITPPDILSQIGIGIIIIGVLETMVIIESIRSSVGRAAIF